MIKNGDVLYVIQLNMAGPDQNPVWDNCGAYQDRDRAIEQIKWMKDEYGDEIECRIDPVNFYDKS
jgi:hypothetical protein